MKNVRKLLITLLVCSGLSAQNKYFVSTNGDDNNPGTIDKSWGTWAKAFSTAQPGDTVYFRSGTWHPKEVFPRTNTAVLHSPDQAPKSGYNGTANKKICFFNYPGEEPILDCSQIDTVGRRFNSGISLTGSRYLHLKGLTITNVFQPYSQELACGIGANECSYLIFENITVSNIGGRGMTYWGVAGHPDVPEIPDDTTKYINCDVYNCIDSLSEVPGNGSDGWKLDNESAGYLYFYGCRAWNCGDDGFDISGPGIAVLDHCWSFDHNMPGAPDGNGFKFGGNRGNGAYHNETGDIVLGTPNSGVRKKVVNCIAVNNAGFGFYELGYAPYYPNNSRVFNNISYSNGIGIQMATNDDYSGKNPSIYRNNIIFKPVQKDAGGRPYFLSVVDIYLESHNNWDFADKSEIGSLMWWKPTDTVTVTDDDFVSLDDSQLHLPRKKDGSLPDITFLKLLESSDLIDAGTDVGIPYQGATPDIGVFEFNPIISLTNEHKDNSILFHCCPNPTNGKIKVTFNTYSIANIKIVNSIGTIILSKNIQNGYTIDLTPYANGIYFLILNEGRHIYSTNVLKFD